MPPPRSSPFRTVTDWIGDPWATAEEKLAWDRERKQRWIASLTPRDWDRIAEATEQVTPLRPGVSVEGLDAGIRVAVTEIGHAKYFSGVKFGTFRGFVLIAWAK